MVSCRKRGCGAYPNNDLNREVNVANFANSFKPLNQYRKCPMYSNVKIASVRTMLFISVSIINIRLTGHDYF
jgi:hypothetical protein